MILFKKYVGDELCVATPVYKGYYNDKIFTMSFESKELFDAELRGLAKTLSKTYAPQVLDIDVVKKEIVLDWKNAQNLNHAFYKNTQPTNWKEQVKHIVKDLESSGLYKLNLYPHTFYTIHNKIYIMDLHACLSYDDVILKNDIKHIINDQNRFKFENEKLDILYTYNYTLENNVGDWPEEILND